MKTVEKPDAQKGDPANTADKASHRIPKGTRPEVIKKFPVKANIENYEQAYATFSWEEAKKEISYLPDGKLNAAYNAIDRHLHDGRRNKVALYAVDANNKVEKYTFQDMYHMVNKVGNGLKSLGTEKGDRVFVFLPRVPELYAITVAIAKIGAVAGPLFSAFGPDALRDRLQDSGAKIVITNPTLKPKLDEIRSQLPDLQYIIIVGADKSKLGPGELAYEDVFSDQSDELQCTPTSPEDPLYLLYTSGTTGKPKGVLHVHNDILGHHMTTKWVLDLRDDDVYWCTADPGWVTGTVYSIFGPWSNGASVVTYEGKFDAASWYKLIDQMKITVWYTAPTALRMLMKAGDEVVFHGAGVAEQSAIAFTR